MDADQKPVLLSRRCMHTTASLPEDKYSKAAWLGEAYVATEQCMRVRTVWKEEGMRDQTEMICLEHDMTLRGVT